MKKFHPKIYASSDLSKEKPRFDQKCPLCDFTSKLRSTVEKHLQDVHNVEEVSNCKVLYFLTNDEFLKWKKDLEKSTNTLFIQPCGTQRSKTVKTTYYYCNRSGYFVPKGAGKRVLRAQGSSKINSVCPAKIKKLEKETDGIEVHYLDIHLGHTNDLHYLHLQKEEKDEIALKIAQNVPFESILQEIKQSVETGEKIERLKLLTKKDLWNIKYAYTANGMLDRMTSIISELKKQSEASAGESVCDADLSNIEFKPGQYNSIFYFDE